MSSFLDRLNLRPQERRLLVVVATVFFVVLNVWFVFPRFKDLGQYNKELEEAPETLPTYRQETANIPKYKDRLAELEGQGLSVMPEDQARQLRRTIESKARATGVSYSNLSPGNPRNNDETNEFFQEQSWNIRFTTGEEELVDFLYQLGADNSMIRVRNLVLGPDTSRQKLQGDVTLVASYQVNPGSNRRSGVASNRRTARSP
jgi:Tfp pilus assembly protein PilO